MPAKKHINLNSFLPFQSSYDVVVQLCRCLTAVESMGHVTEGKSNRLQTAATRKREGPPSTL
jgi:hypothetical protein